MNNRRDERIVAQRRKIQSDAYQILIYCLIASIVVQQFILHAPFAQFAVELFCLLGAGIYAVVRHLSAGIDIWNTDLPGGKGLFLGSMLFGVLAAVLFMLLSGEKRMGTLALFFLAVTVCHYLVQLLLRHLIRKKQKQIDDALEDDRAVSSEKHQKP